MSGAITRLGRLGETKLIGSMVYPWRDVVKLCKKYGILSMVDGAHSIGQEKLDLSTTDCDFFVSVRSPSRTHIVLTLTRRRTATSG